MSGLFGGEALSGASSPSAKKMGKCKGRAKAISKLQKEDGRALAPLELRNMELKK